MTLMLGSWTRINGAGLTCPDWPLCRGHLLPSLRRRHDLGMAAPLARVRGSAARHRAHRRRVAAAPKLAVRHPDDGAIALLFLVQVLPRRGRPYALPTRRSPSLLHWATAMALIAALSAMAVFATASDRGANRRAHRRGSYALPIAIGLTAAAAFATMCIGAYVSSSGAGLACLSIPQCAGNVVVYTPGQYVQMLHRIAAGVTLVLRRGNARARMGAAALRTRVRAARRLSGSRSSQFKCLLGLLNVALRLPTDLARSARRQCRASLSCLLRRGGLRNARCDAARPRPAARRKQRPPMTLLARLRDYYELSKPRIIVLLLITTAASMVMAARGMPPLRLLFWTLLAGALAAASAGAFNCVWDADIDRVMKRTQSRPIPQGRISRRHAAIYAAIAGALSFGLFYVLVNPLAAWLSLAGNLYYVVIYTMWLKRITPLNIVVGGAAGSVPPLVGWAAVTHTVGAPALGLFALIFLMDAAALLVARAHDRDRLRQGEDSDVPQRLRKRAHQARDRLLQLCCW